ncbi:anthranilate phosphoribosyltransferase [Aidingimonas halophila]|uniref:Anthranilate phosphoribosyltransferase n=1 Tax=Aidingimonas halophila TaxID=574349 RepID=A0A1H3H5U6_9GAMM|nr:anthranilate phosphoribosyltransferase [Aidingimonas halophila]GHC36676.1 anthranilate phosphoribosyltransferase [Aidingimonas halophila]SDY10866.1 anthranilate phosphoribosyltransferase [Aidingimonas halophila]
MQMSDAIGAVMRRQNLSFDDMHAVMHTIMTGEATEAQIGGFLIGLSMKGETVEEISAAAQVMRELMTPVTVHSENVVDIVGTGGDGANLFNVSTAASFVAAAGGAHVAKHGNRSVSSSSGSADLFSVAGISLELDAEQVSRCIDQVGVGFMFAPMHHQAMRHAVGPRREMGVRTLFNILGPLTNPASAPNQLLGVYHTDLVPMMADVLKRLGSHHVLVVNAEDGLDEISLAAPTRVAELKDGEIHEYRIAPEDFGIERQALEPLKVVTAEDSLRLVHEALAGEGPAADIVALNAGAALYAADVADSIAEGVSMAQDAQASGLPNEKMKELADFTRVYAQ